MEQIVIKSLRHRKRVVQSSELNTMKLAQLVKIEEKATHKLTQSVRVFLAAFGTKRGQSKTGTKEGHKIVQDRR